MGGASTLYQSESLNIQDSDGKIRSNLLKKYLPNTIDAIRFYHFTGKLAGLPVVGPFIKKGLYLYYRYMHTNSLVYPLREMEAVINTATDIYVDPCPCRVVAEDQACDAPLYTCMRINHTATLRKEMKNSQGLSKEDALSILRNAAGHGLVLSLESCIQPYQNNICMCCSCCCIGMKMRYDYGVPIYNSGPYLPLVDPENCTGCSECTETCPVGALSMDDGSVKINWNLCLGCGLCADACPSRSISMVFHKERVRRETPPGKLRLLLSLAYIHTTMIPSVLLFKLVAGSKQANMDRAEPNGNDFFHGTMQ